MLRLFSIRGRISRGTYWAIKLSVATVLVIIAAVVLKAGHAQPGDRHGFDHALAHLPPMVHVAVLAAFGLAIWIMVATFIKRLHDLDLSGGQFVGARWRVMFNDGTVGPNRYGPDPLVRNSQPT
jgi:uncharacterized membrane protein YhaH (DUF805 family)